MERYSDLIPQLVPELPGCPQGVLMQALRQAGRDFCRMTEAWQETVTEDVTKDKTVYDIVPYGDGYIHRITDLRINGISQDTDRYNLTADWEITLVNASQEDITDGMEVDMVLRPGVDANELTELFFDRYAEAIKARTLYLLTKQSNKTYSNPEQAKLNSLEFDGYVSEALNEKQYDYKSPEQRMSNRIADGW